MDSSDRFWIYIWSLVSICFITFVVTLSFSIYSTNIDRSAKIASMVATGANPIAARCALEGTSNDIAVSIMCANTAK